MLRRCGSAPRRRAAAGAAQPARRTRRLTAVAVDHADSSAPGAWPSCPTAACWSRRRAAALVIVSADGAARPAPLAGVPAVARRRPGRPARRGDRPRLRHRPAWVYLELRRSRRRRRQRHRGRARPARRAATRCRRAHGDLPPAAQGRRQRPLRLAARVRAPTRRCSSRSATASRAARRRTSRSHLGKVVRINRDGSVPADNPFVGAGARPEHLELRPPQPAGRGAAPDDRRAVGERARPAGRRRAQHRARRQQLRLAAASATAATTASPVGDCMPHRRRQRTRRTYVEPRDATGCRPRSRPAAWPSTPARRSPSGRAACSSARWPARRCGG